MEIELDGRRIEYEELPGRDPALLFLHEGLGSVGLWRDFPQRIASLSARRALVYSRWGHGRSDPPPARRGPDFMRREADEVLPRLLDAWSVERPVLVGHSDGASIALVHAASHPVAALVCIAPHVFVEEVCLAEIGRARDAYERDGRRERMAAHHRDPDATFHGWSDVWLDPAFAGWSIQGLLGRIDAPVLVIQGTRDPYGTTAHAEAIAAGVRGPVRTLLLDCRHAPHVQAEEETVAAVAAFVTGAGSLVAQAQDARGRGLA